MATMFSKDQEVISIEDGKEYLATVLYIRLYNDKKQYRIHHCQPSRGYRWVPVGEEEGNIRKMTVEDKLKYLQIEEKSEKDKEGEEEEPQKKITKVQHSIFEGHPPGIVPANPNTIEAKLEFAAGEKVHSFWNDKWFTAVIFGVARVPEGFWRYYLRHDYGENGELRRVRTITVGVNDHTIKKIPGEEEKRKNDKYHAGEKVLTKFDGVRHIGVIVGVNVYTHQYTVQRDLWGKKVTNYVHFGTEDDVIQKWPAGWP